VFFVDSNRAIIGEAVFDSFWFVGPFKRFSRGLFDEPVDPVKTLLVIFLPLQSVFSGVVGKKEAPFNFS